MKYNGYQILTCSAWLGLLLAMLLQTASLAQISRNTSSALLSKSHEGFRIEGGVVTISATAKFDDSDFALLHSFRSNMRTLVCQSSAVSDTGLITLLRQMDRLESLVVDGPAATDSLIAACRSLGSLKSLELSGPFDGHALVRLADSELGESLTSLCLHPRPLPPSGTQVGESFGLSLDALTAISKLSGLQELDLSSCGINDSKLELLAKLPRLQQLSLDGNPIDGAGLMALDKHPQLQYLSIYKNTSSLFVSHMVLGVVLSVAMTSQSKNAGAQRKWFEFLDADYRLYG